ncbi:MAG: hypothetical protein HYU64_01295 [Armatimonadetes bacterium]|nr:hypothetical protein [Armatimonadota bacterium]
MRIASYLIPLFCLFLVIPGCGRKQAAQTPPAPSALSVTSPKPPPVNEQAPLVTARQAFDAAHQKAHQWDNNCVLIFMQSLPPIDMATGKAKKWEFRFKNDEKEYRVQTLGPEVVEVTEMERKGTGPAGPKLGLPLAFVDSPEVLSKVRTVLKDFNAEWIQMPPLKAGYQGKGVWGIGSKDDLTELYVDGQSGEYLGKK